MLQQSSVYQVFLRSYGEHAILTLQNDLERIRSMGFDYLYLMPIHPISKINRKGTIGSPYSIADYYAVDEALGTMVEFEVLVQTAHDLGLKVIMDMVFNHTGGDHYYLEQNPDFYFRDEQNNLVHRIGDWSDIVDLDLRNEDLHQELIAVLKHWSKKQIDGFRFDVASLIPMNFWRKAKLALQTEYPHLVWIAESIDLNFHQAIKKQGIEVENIPALAEVFDVFYDYETWDVLQKAFTSVEHLEWYTKVSNRQFLMQPDHTLLWRFVENHDQDRLASRSSEIETWLIFTLLSYGMGFIFQGQEWGQKERTSIFEIDLLLPREAAYGSLIQQLNTLKKQIYENDVLGYHLEVDQGILSMEITTTKTQYIVLLNPYRIETSIRINLVEGYDLLKGQPMKFNEQMVHSHQMPLVIEKLT